MEQKKGITCFDGRFHNMIEEDYSQAILVLLLVMLHEST